MSATTSATKVHASRRISPNAGRNPPPHPRVLAEREIPAQHGHAEGLAVRYTVRDPLVGELLAVARRIFNNQLAGTRGLLRELQRERRGRRERPIG